MDEIAAPGILAYRAGDCFANLASLMSEMPARRDISVSTLESVLQQHVILSFPMYTETDYSPRHKVLL